MNNGFNKLAKNVETLGSFWSFFKKDEIVSDSKNILEEIEEDYLKCNEDKNSNLQKVKILEQNLSECKNNKENLENKVIVLNEDIKVKENHINELDVKQKLTSKLLATASTNSGLLQFRDILNNDFLTFANDENSVSNEAEMLLKLQEIEKELELISSHPNLHSKHLVAVGGGFSAGKSEFISSFIESGIKLPIGVVPTTAIPSYVMHENTNKFIGCTNRGGIVDLEEVDSNFQARLSHSFIKSFGFNLKNIMPFMVLGTQIKYENMCFVDTPGYNPATSSDGFTGEDIHTATEFLDNANTLLWLIGADANGTIPASDLEFLSSLNLEDKKLFIVFNKADLRPLDSIEDVLVEIEDSLDDYDIEIEGICAYSSIMKKEFSFIGSSLLDFLVSINNEVKKHDEVIKKLFYVHETYRRGILKSIKEKNAIRKQLQSVSLDILEDGVDVVENPVFERITFLKKYFSIEDEKKQLKILDSVFENFSHSIENVFGKSTSIQLSKINIDDVELDYDFESRNNIDEVLEKIKK